jgi:hypothetical protein
MARQGKGRNIYMPSPLWKLIEQIAEITGSSNSSVIRYAVLRYAEQLGLLDDLMKTSLEKVAR